MRIKKKIELPKLSKQKTSQSKKKMSMTVTSTIFPHSQSISSKLLPPSDLRKTSINFQKNQQYKDLQESDTTTMGSEMLQSYYETLDKGWTKPSEYLQQIKNFNLITDGPLDMENYQIKLSESMEKNVAKLDSLMSLIQKWISILKKLLQYSTSKKSATPHLSQQIKFWRTLSKKFDQLQYQFNNDKINQLLTLMKHSLKTQSKYQTHLEQFIQLKNQVITTTPIIRKLYLSLQEGVSGNIHRFIQSSNIVQSTQYLKQILLTYSQISQTNPLAHPRMQLVFDKMNDAMIHKLTFASLDPRSLANISYIKQKYSTIDKALSFYYNFINIIQSSMNTTTMQLIYQRANHTRNVLVNLLQILGYFQYLYLNKQVLQFSKLFSINFQCNIFDYINKQQWNIYMDKVNESMKKKNYQP